MIQAVVLCYKTFKAYHVCLLRNNLLSVLLVCCLYVRCKIFAAKITGTQGVCFALAGCCARAVRQK